MTDEGRVHGGNDARPPAVLVASDGAVSRGLARWAARAVVGVIASVVASLLMGVPTDVIPNDWFTRMTPVRPADVALLVASSLALGALAATYVGGGTRTGATRGASGGVLTGLAVGCPVCNKAVVALLGTTGAVNWFGPAQPFIGAFGLGLVLWSLALRLRAPRACALPAPGRYTGGAPIGALRQMCDWEKKDEGHH